MNQVLGFPAARIGLLLSFTGLVATLTNAFMVGALSRRFSGRKIMVLALLVLVRARGGGEGEGLLRLSFSIIAEIMTRICAPEILGAHVTR